MSEIIIQSGRTESFTVLYNSMITDKRLSLKAKGLFAVMVSRPGNWKFSISGLAAFTGTGKDSIRSIIGELEKVGYLIRAQAHKTDGTFGGNIYVLQDVAPPLSGNTDNGETRQRDSPSPENPTQRKKDLKKDCKKDIPPTPQGGVTAAEVFERFWTAFPKKKGKEAARRAWNRLAPDMDLCRVMAAALAQQKASREWTRDGGRYIPYPASWLNGRRWEDEVENPPETPPPAAADDARRGQFL